MPGRDSKERPGPGALHYARELRKRTTDAEKALWRLLRDRRLIGAKFRRQHPFGPYILDFYCLAARLAVELDGGQHLTLEGMARDGIRTRYIEGQNVRLLRFNDRDVLLEAEAVAGVIAQALARPSP